MRRIFTAECNHGAIKLRQGTHLTISSREGYASRKNRGKTLNANKQLVPALALA